MQENCKWLFCLEIKIVQDRLLLCTEIGCDVTNVVAYYFRFKQNVKEISSLLFFKTQANCTNLIAFNVRRTHSLYGLESRLYGTTLIEWMDRSWDAYLASPADFFCRGGSNHKGERAWDPDHRTHSLIFDYYQYLCSWCTRNQIRLIKNDYLE